MVNHASGLEGRDGLRTILKIGHWATRDEMGMLVQVGAGPQTSRS